LVVALTFIPWIGSELEAEVVSSTEALNMLVPRVNNHIIL
jgi:hypothetical protein